MNWFKNMKISLKLITGFIIVAVIAGIIGVVGIININTLNSNDTALYTEKTVPISQLSQISELYQRSRVSIRDIILLPKEADKNKEADNLKNKNAEIQKLTDQFDKLTLTEKERSLFNVYKTALNNYLPYSDRIVGLVLAKNEAGAEELMLGGEADKASMDVQDAIMNMESQMVADAKTASYTNDNIAARSVFTMIAFIAAGMFLAVLLGLLISRTISIPIKKLEDAANKISNGDIDIELETGRKDELGVLTGAFNKIVLSLHNLINDTNALSKAAEEGKLDTRAELNKHNGVYRKIVNGVNSTLDLIVEPLNQADQILEKISLNDYTMKMDGNYRGVLKNFADSINGVHARLLSIQDNFMRISKGDLSRLEEVRGIGKRCENDKLVPAMLATMLSIQELIEESRMLVNASVNGDLNVRGNADKFEGGYKEIIEGMNKTMDAVAEPIRKASAVMDELAHGDLTVSMDGDYKGEYAKIKDSLNFVISSLNDVLNDINDAASQVAAGSGQIAEGGQELSQGATEQACSIEELTASIEEIAAQTKQNANDAGQANTLSVNAKNNAIKGNDQMKQMLDSMAEINESSANISKIIKVIDDIAFQTNILALNAAVEAARAGQHGKGFAVVAEEVRNLAARSANASKETTALIDGSIKKVEAGTKIANDTANELKNIVDEVNKVASLVEEIAEASNEQATGVAQIDKGIEQISQVVQSNSASAEESAAASEELSSQAELLKEMVEKFKLKRGIKARDKYEPKNKAAADRKYTGEKTAAEPSKSKIVLSDNEFGKY